MNKVLKKIGAVVMSAALCVGIIGSAFAATTTASTDTGTITISGVEEGLTVNAYKIAEAEYDNTGVGEFTGYKMLYSAGGFSIDQYGNWDESALTEANLSALFTAAQTGGVTYSTTADADGVATFTNMPVGAYLFIVTGSESTVYSIAIGSVYYAVDESTGEWKIVNGEVDVQGTNAWVKSTTPTVTKVEKGGDQDGWTHGGTADVGDTLNYEITAGPIPNYEGAYPEFELVDKIDSKLQITDEEFGKLTVKVVTTDDENEVKTVTLVSGTDYVATKTDDGFTIDFVVNGSYTLNGYVGQYIVVDFDADVVEAGNIDADDADHENDVTLNYATTSYVIGYEGHVDDADHDYTFNAKILKTDGTNPLAGASFTLYTDETCTTEYQQNDVTMTVTSGEDGYFEFTGLQAGTYYFKETTAPTGYALNTDIYKLVITATEKEDGTIDSYTITVYNPDNTTNGTATVSQTSATVVNTVLGTLPSMGSTGITLCIIAGCVVLAGAVAGVAIYRRRNNAEV